MRAGKFDIVVEEGVDYNKRIQWKDKTGSVVNLSGYTATFKAKNTKADSDDIISLAVGSGITLNASLGLIDIAMTATETAALDFDRAVYELVMINGSSKYRLLEGNLILSRKV